MWFRNGFLAGEMFVRGDLIRQFVLLNTAGVAGRLRRPNGVLANFVFEVVWHFEPEKMRPSQVMYAAFWKTCPTKQRNRRISPEYSVWLWLLALQEPEIDKQNRIGRNKISDSIRAITKMRSSSETSIATDSHSLDPVFNGRDLGTLAEQERVLVKRLDGLART